MEKKILVTRSSMPSLEEYCAEIDPLWESRWLTNNGEKHRELEQKLCEFLGASRISLCTNGHTALEYILETLELSGEVITTPFTFVSTTNAIIRRGMKPVFCDVKPDDFTLDPEKIEPLITENTSAILPVHVYGNVCDYEAIEKIAEKYHLKVIYDAAHAFGVTVNGRGVASLGDASMFSFHATKVFHTIEGGAAVFKDPSLCDRLNKLKSFGIDPDGTLDYPGGNAKMNEFSAAMGLCNLRHIDRALAARKAAATRYRELLSDVAGLTLSPLQAGVKSNCAYFPVIVDPALFGCSRDELFDRLDRAGIGARKYFYPLTSTVCETADETPVAKTLSERVLCLPLYEELDAATVERICKVITKG